VGKAFFVFVFKNVENPGPNEAENKSGGRFAVGKIQRAKVSYDLKRMTQTFGPKKDPSKTDSVVNDKPFDPGKPLILFWNLEVIVVNMVDSNSYGVNGSPNHKSPIRSMPQSPQQHRDRNVSIFEKGALPAIPTQGDVKVITQPSRKRDVPAVPKFLHASGYVGSGEVFRKVVAKHQGQSDRHISVT